MPQRLTDLPRKWSSTVCRVVCVCLPYYMRVPYGGVGVLKTSIENLIFVLPHIFSVHLPFSRPLRKPHLSIHPSILTQLKRCCLFAVSLPWFPLCFLPALVWRTKRWWWIVFRESKRQREREAKRRKKMYVHMLYLFFATGCLMSSLSLRHTHTHAHWSSIRIPRVPRKVERQLYTNTPFGVRCLALASLIF